MAQEVFITGATGFLGRRLLAELLRQSDCRFHVLVRSPCAQETLIKHLRPAELDRVRFVRGDITLPGLGIDDQTLGTLATSVTEVWHLAASTAFEESKRKETFRVNVEGSRALCDLVRRFRKLDIVYHMSTAYVCGKKLGCIPEGPFQVAEGFKNPYEESKYRSEEVVRTSGLPVVILRPSIVMGDSQTGDCHGELRMMYGFAFGLLRAAMHAFDDSTAYWRYWNDGVVPAEYVDVNARLFGHGDAHKNCVTVDDVVAVCAAVRRSNPVGGRTYNIVNPNSLTCLQVLNAIQRAMKVRGYIPDPELTCHTVKTGSLVERVAYRNMKLFSPYTFNTDPHWETSNVDNLGVTRVVMTETVFEFMMNRFVRSLVPDA